MCEAQAQVEQNMSERRMKITRNLINRDIAKENIVFIE